MSETYTKLFTSITASTVWQEPAGTRLTWITMLAMADQNGDVYASVPGLARIANVPREDVERALVCFLSPDPDSRTREHEGRRVEEIEGGWRLLNHSKFHALRSEADRAAYKRAWDRKNRPVRQRNASPTETRQPDTNPDDPTVADLPNQTKPLLQEARATSLVRQAGRFAEFWALYPNKTGKKPCQAKWLKRGLDALADQIIADVRLRKAEDRRWLEGFVPNPETYLNQDRWDDEIQRRQPVRAGPNGTPGKQMQGIMALEGLKSGNRLDAGRDRDGAAEALPALVGPNTGR